MIALTYYCFILATVLMGLSARWRTALFMCIVLDVLRDPVRKMTPFQPVTITVVISLAWLAVVGGAIMHEQGCIKAILNEYPALKNVFYLFIAAIIPGTLVSIGLYDGGWKLAMIGLISYGAPILGLLAGCTFARQSEELWQLLLAFIAVNAIALTGTYFEAFGWNVPGLGGLQGVNWVRTHSGGSLQLYGGFYRSPDVMGLHAAHVVIFSIIGIGYFWSQRKQGWIVWAMMFAICWASYALILSGRRKMLAMPIVFLAIYFMYIFRSSHPAVRRLMTAVSMVAIGLSIILLQTAEVPSASLEYSESIWYESADRIQHSVWNSVWETIRQNGVMGYGLGVATQGSRYVANPSVSSWQEDGLSRAVGELGVPGLLIAFVSIVSFAGVIRQSVARSLGNDTDKILQWGLVAIVLANGATFIVSHQVYSGDPSIAMLIGLETGFILALGARPSEDLQVQPVADESV